MLRNEYFAVFFDENPMLFFVYLCNMKILMVCLGNICRSPMADGLLRKKINALDLPWAVDSAGTADYHSGKAPDRRMQATAKQFGIDISTLQARQFRRTDFDEFDVIYAMDYANFIDIQNKSRSEKDRLKVHRILDELADATDKDVPDPYYGSEQDFIDVYHLLDRATDQIIQRLLKDAER